jgi:hypothetical protein
MNEQTIEPGPEPSYDGRRRFLKAGLVAAPLLMTLAARPAQAESVMVAGTLGAYGYGIDDEDLAPLGADDTDAFGAL